MLGALGCHSRPAALPNEPPAQETARDAPPPAALISRAGLEWLVLLRPRELMDMTWLLPSLDRVLRGKRFDLLHAAIGIDVRQVSEIALASSATRGGSCIAVVARHTADPLAVERLFRDRLTSDEQRSIDGHQMVRLRGRLGTHWQAFASIGPNTAVFQYGGDPDRGPVRIATLYAEGKLERVPPLLADPATRELLMPVLGTPVLALIPGPFEGELGRGARGLLAAASGATASLTPTHGKTLRLQVRIHGDFSADPQGAGQLLYAAWDDLSQADLGHLLGLHQPATAPVVETPPGALAITAELEPGALFNGLAAATTDSIREIMRRASTVATPSPDKDPPPQSESEAKTENTASGSP